jgi:hypothetical protein
MDVIRMNKGKLYNIIPPGVEEGYSNTNEGDFIARINYTQTLKLLDEAKKDFPWIEPLPSDAEYQNPRDAYIDSLMVWTWFKKWFGDV